MRKAIQRWLSSGMVAAALLAPTFAHADFVEDAGMGTATVLANVFYMPTKLEKDTDPMSVEFTSRIDAPLDVVLRSFAEPERSAEFSPIVRYSKLVRSEGNKKVVEFEMVILGQPQHFTMEFTFLPTDQRVTLKTVDNAMTDLN